MVMQIEHKGVIIRTCEDVYEPAEDTFLLLDALEGEISPSDSVLEIGCGSGIVSIFAAMRARRVTAVDINPAAVSCTKRNASLISVSNVDAIQSDLFSEVSGRFDVVIFNTPYVPTEADEGNDGAGIERAWDGGRSGRDVIDRFLAAVGRHVDSGGKIFMVESTKSSYDNTVSFLEKTGYKVHVAKKLKLFFEELVVIKATRTKQKQHESK